MSSNQELKHTEIIEISSYDNYKITGKLDLPLTSQIDKMVIFVNGSGPNTYDNRRKTGELEFNYYDLYSDELIKRGIAFFRYSTRGASPGTEPPMFTDVDDFEYKKYLPSNSVKDIESIITFLRGIPRLKDTKVYLLGCSEGTIIAPLVAKSNIVDIHGLLLVGYCNDSLYDILTWQLSGGSSMVFYRRFFDLDGKGYITKEDFDEDKYCVRQSVLKGVLFDEVDVNKDGKIDINDFRTNQHLKQWKDGIFKAISDRDDEWLKISYPVRLTSQWFLEHFSLQPNKEVLLDIDVPIHIFHGIYDQSCPVEGVYDIAERFKKANKCNLNVHVFDNHDHDLNYMGFHIKGLISDGLNEIFKVCGQI